MRLYGGRAIKTAISRGLSTVRESRNATIIEVFLKENYATVYFQGSTQPVKAFFHKQLQVIPTYIKTGNPVRVLSPGGNGGRIEIVAHGTVRQTV